MILYFWINKYKHINKTGFNLSSKYDFKFVEDINVSNENKISGKLLCEKLENPKIFHDSISDIKAIIGENGSGKSTLIEALIQNIMTKTSSYFDGFIVTDKFVFNRSGIYFAESINEITFLDLKLISNYDLVNYDRNGLTRKVLTEEEIKYYNDGQIATRHLNNSSIIHYSPLLNVDRISNIEGLAGSSKTWETNYWHYYDFTTENCIVDDYNTLSISESNYYISGESELLAHKSAESKRNLEFLSDEIFKELPFKNNIKKITIRLNDFYQRFWESIDSYFKSDNDILGNIEEVIYSIKKKDNNNKESELESNIFISLIYGALKYEYRENMNFGNRGDSNALISTIQTFTKSIKKAKSNEEKLYLFLEKANFPRQSNKMLIKKIKRAIKFVLKCTEISTRNNYDFSISLSNPKAIKDFLNLFYNEFQFDERSFVFEIFSIEFKGLSSGEKNLLSMFSRFKRAADTIIESQSDIIFILDEPEVMLHPQWQVSFINLLNNHLHKLFPNKKLQIIISSHSPMLISDLPKTNILFLEKDKKTGNCKVAELKTMQNTFGANIHSLYSDAFFLKDKGGAMGEFAKKTIKNVIKELDKDFPTNKIHLKIIIDQIGEPLIRNQLTNLFYKKFPEERIENIDDRIDFLEQELALIKKIKENSKDEIN